jgi:hypothetical protein
LSEDTAGTEESIDLFSLNAYVGNTENRVEAIGNFFFKVLSHTELKAAYKGNHSPSNLYLKSVWEYTGK